jgi:hypothetical protein
LSIGSQWTYIITDEEPSEPFQAAPDILASQMDINECEVNKKENKRKRKHITEENDEEEGGEEEA